MCVCVCVCVCVCASVHTCTCKCVDWQDETCLEGVENPSHPEGAEQLPISGTSLAVQWLSLCTLNAGGLGSIPGQGTRSHNFSGTVTTTTKRARLPQQRPSAAK